MRLQERGEERMQIERLRVASLLTALALSGQASLADRSHGGASTA
jgi:hypothetical protein